MSRSAVLKAESYIYSYQGKSPKIDNRIKKQGCDRLVERLMFHGVQKSPFNLQKRDILL